MELARFQRLVRFWEQAAERSPRGVHWAAGALAVIGYLYLVIAIVALLLGLVVVLLAALGEGSAILALYAVPLIYALFAVAQALNIPDDRPTGIEVPLDRIPRMRALLDELARRSDGPRIHRVLIQIELNASLAQRPRLGVLGWYENTLILGMPILVAFPQEEVRAILAHEIAHLNGGHGRLGLWVARQWTILAQLEARVQQGPHRLGRFVLFPLTRWYLPQLNALNFALRRRHEYEADAFAVREVGVETKGRTLCRLALISRWQQEVRDRGLTQEAIAGRPVPTRIFEDYPGRLAAEITAERRTEWLADALRVPTDFSDSHPALRDRLASIGATPVDTAFDPGAAKSDGRHWIGPDADEWIARANVAWAAASTPQWNEIQQRTAAANAELAALEVEMTSNPLDLDKAWRRASLLEWRDGSAVAGAAARAIVARAPEHIGARFLVARGALAEGDTAGIAELERLVTRDPDLIDDAAAIAFQFLWQRGRATEAEAWRQRHESRLAQRVVADKERRSIGRRIQLAPHRLPTADLERIQTAVGAIAGIKEVYIARRLVRHMPEVPCFLVGVVPVTQWIWKRGPSVATLVEQVGQSTHWPGDTRILPLDQAYAWLVPRMRKQQGAILRPIGS